jgi:hypothetical protein
MMRASSVPQLPSKVDQKIVRVKSMMLTVYQGTNYPAFHLRRGQRAGQET